MYRWDMGTEYDPTYSPPRYAPSLEVALLAAEAALFERLEVYRPFLTDAPAYRDLQRQLSAAGGEIIALRAARDVAEALRAAIDMPQNGTTQAGVSPAAVRAFDEALRAIVTGLPVVDEGADESPHGVADAKERAS